MEVFVSKKRILQVVHSLPVAGTEALVVQIVKALHPDFELGVCCLDSKGVLARELEARHIPVFELRRQPGRDWGAVKRLGQLFESFAPDIVHAHQYTPFFYSALAKTKKTKLVFTEHGRHYPDKVALKRKLFNQWAQFRADKINAVCQFSRKRLLTKEALWAREIGVIYNGVPLKNSINHQSLNLKNDLKIPKKSKVIAFVGRLHSIKNPELLLKAFSTAVKKYPKAHLLFIGEGELRSQLEKIVTKKKITKKVSFIGAKYPVYPFYKLIDLLVLPSLSEGASVTLLEAMAAKVPVIASEVGGNSEFVIDKETGRLFQSENKKELTKLISKFLNKPDKFQEYTKKAFKNVKEQYSQEMMFEEYRQLYENLI